VSSLSALGTDLSSLTCFFAVTEFLAVKATQWVWYIEFLWNTQITDFDMFWDRRSTEGNYEGVCIASIARIIFGRYVEDVCVI